MATDSKLREFIVSHFRHGKSYEQILKDSSYYRRAMLLSLLGGALKLATTGVEPDWDEKDEGKHKVPPASTFYVLVEED